MKILETERLTLRQVATGDAEFIFELLNDPSWVRFIGDTGVRTVKDARDYITNKLVALYQRLGYGLWLVELKEEAVSIGICGLIKRDSLDDVDIGFAFLPGFRGRGYAYESASATMAYGKNVVGLNRIVAITSPDNYASAELLEKLGFQFEKLVRLAGESQDVRLFAWNV